MDADRLWGGSSDSGLIIDETSIPKKGKKSVAVARRWCDDLGIVKSCQVVAFTSLVRGSSAALIDGRLYVPRVWTDDRKRCRDAGYRR
jgi:SRSO17 transposase